MQAAPLYRFIDKVVSRSFGGFPHVRAKFEAIAAGRDRARWHFGRDKGRSTVVTSAAMGRRIRTAVRTLRAFSATLFAVLTVLWIQSYRAGLGVQYLRSHHSKATLSAVAFEEGSLAIGMHAASTEDPAFEPIAWKTGLANVPTGFSANHYYHIPLPSELRSTHPVHGVAGFYHLDEEWLETISYADSTVRVHISREVFECPLWFLVAITLFLPARGVIAFHRQRVARRRQQAGLCIVCGYDLSASPHRCPECGSVANLPKAS